MTTDKDQRANLNIELYFISTALVFRIKRETFQDFEFFSDVNQTVNIAPKIQRRLVLSETAVADVVRALGRKSAEAIGLHCSCLTS